MGNAVAQEDIASENLSNVDFYDTLSGNGLDLEALEQTRQSLGEVFDSPEVTEGIDRYI